MLSLQNGSDIRGIATDGIPGESINLTPARVESIATSFVLWLAEKTQIPSTGLKISVGRDTRISGPLLMDAFIRGIVRTGASAVDCGIASTPAMFMSTVMEGTNCDGAAMLTASHLPFNRNGIKFFTNTGGLDKKDITYILNLAGTGTFTGNTGGGKVSGYDLMSDYSAFLVQTIRAGVDHPENFDRPLTGFRILVDAGNGSGGFFTDKVLAPLGADTSGSLFLEPDGTFPNHAPNPEDDKAMAFLQEAVVEHQAHLGIMFDTDVDRAAAVGPDGRNIHRNRLIALTSAIVLEEHPGSVIVTDSVTSDGLTDFIVNLGGRHHRFKRGYRNVINEAVRLNREGQESWLAIETSGHAALRENYFLDDGAFLMVKILIKMAKMHLAVKSLQDLIAGLKEPAESKEFRVRIKNADFVGYGRKVLETIGASVPEIPGWSLVPDNYEGVRVACGPSHGDGWYLIRMSLHDPVLPLNIESNHSGGIRRITSTLQPILERFEDLEFSLSF
jgi:phosphomannomutase